MFLCLTLIFHRKDVETISIKILVATHKLATMPSDTTIYLPVLVGAQKNWRSEMKYQRDDEGDNISSKNPNYNELTAIYWAWKNLDGEDAIGLVHYRRFLYSRNFFKKTVENVLNENDIKLLLKSYDIILPKKRNYYIETNYTHYVHAHEKEPLDETRRVIADCFPEYLSAFDTIMSRRGAHMFNMFIMKKKIFDNYCEWVFKILSNVENRIDISGYSQQEKRVFGYISELLLDVWIMKQQPDVNVKEVYWGMLGKKHTIKKIYYLIKRKFGSRTKTHF